MQNPNAGVWPPAILKIVSVAGVLQLYAARKGSTNNGWRKHRDLRRRKDAHDVRVHRLAHAAKNTINIDNEDLPGVMASIKLDYELRGGQADSLLPDGTNAQMTLHEQNGTYSRSAMSGRGSDAEGRRTHVDRALGGTHRRRRFLFLIAGTTTRPINGLTTVAVAAMRALGRVRDPRPHSRAPAAHVLERRGHALAQQEGAERWH